MSTTPMLSTTRITVKRHVREVGCGIRQRTLISCVWRGLGTPDVLSSNSTRAMSEKSHTINELSGQLLRMPSPDPRS